MTDPDRFIPIDTEMYRESASYRWQIEVLRKLVDYAERAMEAEGIDQQTRRRVISRIVLGGPDPDEARRELRQQTAHIEELRRTALPKFTLDDLRS